MELRHLRYFLAVAEELHFRRAAERLHMSQPPLSQQVRQLEEELEVTLLERDRRGVRLTPAGAAFRDEARAILLHVDSAVDQVRRVAHGEVGRLRVGFVGTAMYGPVPELLRRFREARPGIELQLREMATAAQLEALRGGRIDVGFLRPPRAALEGGVRTAVIHREPVVAVLPASHALAGRARIRLEELRDEAFVLLARSGAPGLYDAVTLAMAQAGTVPRVVQEVAEVQTAIGLTAAGIGLTLVPASVGARVHGAAVAVALGAPVPEVELHVAIGPGRTSAVVAALLATAGVDLLGE